jgi:glucokinase
MNERMARCYSGQVPSVLAVDFGGTKTSVAVVNRAGVVRERVKMPAVRALDESIQQIVATAARYDGLSAVGIIVPGIYTERTGRAWCPNLWGHAEVNLGERARARLHIPVAIDSDRAGSVLGESWLGRAKGLRDVVFVAIGTGIGVGILSDNRIIAGAHGIAGAAGWFALDPDWNNQYERSGCWEAESAGPAIARRFGAVDAAEVVEAAREGHSLALNVLARAARYTGMGVANLISVLNPEMVVLGGGVMQGAGDLLLEQIRLEVSRWAQPIAAGRCPIELTTLGEDAGLLGAARLALNLLEHEPTLNA